MVERVVIYVEGGGDTESTMTPFRQGFSTFLRPAFERMREKRIKHSVVPCGGRKQAYDAFVDAMENEPEVLNLLLVDAEDLLPYPPPKIVRGKVQDPDPWPHFAKRPGDKWAKPSTANSRSCHVMSACMEAWFVADPAGMKKRYTRNFEESALPPPASAEKVAKSVIYAAMDAATRNTPSGKYIRNGKIDDGAQLLALIDPSVVRRHCQWCERLFKALEDAVTQ